MKHRSFGESFSHALSGILVCLKRERSMRIHFAVALLVTACGFLLGISAAEWLVCLIFFALVMGVEALNTSLEALSDIISPEQNPKIKFAKDTAAGAVLLCAIMAAIAGCIIFLPKLAALLSTGVIF